MNLAHPLRAMALLLVLLACSVGQGTGSAHGQLTVPDCRLDTSAWELHPDFFVADFADQRHTISGMLDRSLLQIRMQRGSYGEQASDGINILVRDVDDIAGSLGTPIPVGTDAPVSMTLYLGGSCPSGLPRGDFFTVPVYLAASTGTITFSAIYAPNVDPNALHIAATFTGVRFEDASRPTERFAVLDGDLSFFFQRGRPAQHFP